MKFLTTLLILLVSSGLLHAREPDQQLEPVIVEGSYIKPPLDYPSAFSTVIDLDAFLGEYNTASELLSLSPGVVVRDFGGLGQLKTLSIRGSSNDQVVVLIDGVRLSSPIGGGVDLSTVPIDYIESIEVIRGGGSALAGSDAIGGVVNLITKKTGERYFSAQATYGSFETFKANLTGAGNLGELGYFFSYTHSQSEGDFEFESINGFDVKRINNEFLSESFFIKLDFDIDDWKFSLFNDFYYDDKGIPGLGEFQEPNSNQKDIRNLTSLKIRKDGLFIPTLNFETIIFNRFDELDFKNPEPTIGLPIDTLSKNYSFGFNSKFVWLAPKEQIVTFATELKADILSDDDFNNPERFTLSTYLGDEISFFYNFITLHPIVRLDIFKTFADDNDTEAQVSPKLGLIVSPLTSIALKANVGRSFRAPNFGELFFPEQGFIGGNPDLVSETSIDFDVGLVLSRPRYAFEINYFKNNIDDLILFIFVSAQRIEPRNVGDADQQGIETSLRIRPTDFLELYTAYTLLDGTLDDTGAQLPGRPKHKFDFRGDLDLRYASIFWESHFTDEIPLTAFADSRTTKSRTTHDIGTKSGYKGFNLTLEIKNLFDNKEVRDAFDFPLPGRSFFVTASYNF
jgi:outer membrane cobalamin receptor